MRRLYSAPERAVKLLWEKLKRVELRSPDDRAANALATEVSMPSDETITATITDFTGDTSELSLGIPAESGQV